MSVFSFGTSTAIWWRDLETRLTRTQNLWVWQIPAEQSKALALLAQRTMELQITVQDTAIWIDDGTHSIEVTPKRLLGSSSP